MDACTFACEWMDWPGVARSSQKDQKIPYVGQFRGREVAGVRLTTLPIGRAGVVSAPPIRRSLPEFAENEALLGLN